VFTLRKNQCSQLAKIRRNEVFPNASCVVSLIDRLVHHSEVIAIEGKSYRMKEAKEQANQRNTQ